MTFPAQTSCPHGAADGCEEILLSRRGELWTWTIQGFLPPSPYTGDREHFVPFGVGYVELLVT